VTAQYEKHIGDNVDILTRDGRKFTGLLTAVDTEARTFTVEVTRKVRLEGEKRPRMVAEPETLGMGRRAAAWRYHFDFQMTIREINKPTPYPTYRQANG